jgi:hypothetical protein
MNNESEDKLKGMSGANNFTVPDNYFEQLNRDIQTRIAEEKLKALSTGTGNNFTRILKPMLQQSN